MHESAKIDKRDMSKCILIKRNVTLHFQKKDS